MLLLINFSLQLQQRDKINIQEKTKKALMYKERFDPPRTWNRLIARGGVLGLADEGYVRT